MNIKVTEVEYDGGTIAIGHGVVIDEDGNEGEAVRFGGDWRPMAELAQAVAHAKKNDDEFPIAFVEDWQVLG